MAGSPLVWVLIVELRIPIQNLYYLFCYAWNRFDEGESIDVAGIESPELVDLLAQVLITGLKRLQRRGVDRGYIAVEGELPVLRGRINFAGSIRLALHRAPRLICEFDELQYDILSNQILKATSVRLLKVAKIDPKLARELRGLSGIFDSVSDLRLSKTHFRLVQTNRNNSFYGFLIKICEVIFDSTLPEGGGDQYEFSDVLRDEQKMARIFEDFVRNFLRLEQNEFRVTPLVMRWDTASGGEHLQLLPIMRTDIHLESENQRIIVDTKYYFDTLQSHHGKSSIHSGHLYQLFSYLKNAEALGAAYRDVQGLLLYPAVGDKIAFGAHIQGHYIRVRTVNLDQSWQNIRADLLDAIGVAAPTADNSSR